MKASILFFVIAGSVSLFISGILAMAIVYDTLYTECGDEGDRLQYRTVVSASRAEAEGTGRQLARR